MSTTTDQVAVFWDYENCRPPSNVSGYRVMGEIRKVAQRYGRIKTCRGYADFSELSSPRSVTLRSELQCSGLSMIDCPHNGRKNVADQMMIVDMLTFAIDNERDGSTIVLISGDRDFAYPVSILRFRMCQVIVISPTLPGAHLSLRSQASTFLDWTVMISGLRDDKSSVDSSPPSNANTPLPPTNTGAQNNGKSNIHNVTNLRPQTKHSPEAFPPASRNEAITAPEAPVAPAVMPDNTPPVYAATANTASETAPLTTPPPGGNHVHELAPVAKYVYDGLHRQPTSIDGSPTSPPVHLPSVLSTNSLSSYQSQSDAEGTWTVPLHLRSLVRVLQKYLENGTTQPLRSVVAAELVAQDSKVYENAGVATFWELFRLAVKESLVWYGGQGDEVWVALRHSAAQKLRLLEDDSPPNVALPIPSTTLASLENENTVVDITVANTPPVYAAIAINDDSTSPIAPQPAPVTQYASNEPQQEKVGPLDEPFPLPPAPAVLSPLPSSDPPSSKSQFDTTAACAVPPHFRSLVRVLQKHHENGNTQVQPTVATELVTQDNKVYENAGVTTFWELVGLAVKERLVWCGGHGDNVWISLHHSEVKNSRSSVDDSPLDVAISMLPTAPASRNKAPAVSATMETTPPICAAAIATTDELTPAMTHPPAQNPESAPVARYAYDESQSQIVGRLDEPLPPRSARAPSLPSSAPSLPQSQFSTTAARGVPLHLRSLVRVLQKYHENGTSQPLRSVIAAELVAQDSKAYENAGVTTFWELFRLAIKKSLVWWGGQGDDVWVALHPNAVQRLQSLVDHLPSDNAISMPPTTSASPRNETLVLPTATTTSTTDNTHPPPVHAAAAIAATDELASPSPPPAQNPESTPASRYAHDESQNQITDSLDEPLPPSPVLATSSPPPPSAPTSSQSQFVTLEGRAVPHHLRCLVLILQKHRERGETQPLRGSIAYQLVQQDSEVYSKAGVTTFKDFVNLAVRERLVILGGTMDGGWISLYSDASRSSLPNTMDSASPVSTTPAPLSSSPPTSSQSQFGTPETWTVPPHLRSLVLILQKLREEGENQPSRSSVAIELVKQDRKVYSKAGVTKFKQFAALAVNARLVCLGGPIAGDTWISLHHDVVNKLRSSPLI
ncbi:hypothetical protein PM082_012840 [Marasmius tenuissimus]|nr:hypothetical protein PM082_012840 [Marasmius tenuissimus]